MSQKLVEFDPYDPSLVDDPYPVYTALRDEAPAYYGESQDFWALSRFADVKAALADNETFCSSQGLLVLQATDDYEAPEFPPGNLLLMDPPEHTAYRKLVNKRFLQRGVADLEARIRDTANTLVDRFIEHGSVDLVAEYAAVLPATVSPSCSGSPESESAMSRSGRRGCVRPTRLLPGGDGRAPQSGRVVSAMLPRAARRERARPGDDLLAELAHGGRRRPADRRSRSSWALPIAMLIAR